MSFICLFIFMCPFRCACFCQHWSTSPAAPEARQYGHPALQHLCGNYRFFTSGGAVASEARGTRGKRPHVFWGQQRPPHSDPDLRRAHADLQQRQRSERRPRVCRLLQVKNLLGQWRGSGTLSVSGGGLVAGSARRMVQYRCESRVGDRTPVPVRTRWVWLDRICFHTGITRVTECAAVELKDSLRFDVFFSQLLICCSFLSWSACRRRCSWVYWLLRRWRAASWRDWLDSALTSGSRKYERDFHGKPVRTKTWLEQRTGFKQVFWQTWRNVNSQLESASEWYWWCNGSSRYINPYVDVDTNACRFTSSCDIVICTVSVRFEWRRGRHMVDINHSLGLN